MIRRLIRLLILRLERQQFGYSCNCGLQTDRERPLFQYNLLANIICQLNEVNAITHMQCCQSIAFCVCKTSHSKVWAKKR